MNNNPEVQKFPQCVSIGTKFVNNKVPESDWKENFRMSSSSFKKLCNKLKPYLQKKTTRMREFL